MSRRSGAVRLLAALAFLPPAPAQGQAEAALRAEVRRLEFVVESLTVRSSEASAIASAAVTPPPPVPAEEMLHLVSAGGFRVLTNDTPLPLEEGAAQAWEILTRFYGEEASAIELRPLVIVGIDPDSVGRTEPAGADLVVGWDRPAAELAWRMVQLRAPQLGDTALVDWIGGPPVPMSGRSRMLVRAFDELMFSPYTLGHGCVVEEVSSCLGALRLGDVDSQVAAAFPTASDRRRVAATLERNSRDPSLRIPLERCLGDGEDAGCVAVLEALTPAVVPAIGGRESRRSLLDVALAEGGEGALHRLLTSAGRPMGERLALASGMPIIDLLARWRDEMRRTRTTASAWSWGVGIRGLVWVVFFAIIALTGSRWRAD